MNGTNFLVLADWDDNILLTLSLVVGDLLILRKSFSWTEDRTKCSKFWWMCWVSTWNLQAKILMQCLHRVQILLTMMQIFIDWNCRNGLQRRFFPLQTIFFGSCCMWATRSGNHCGISFTSWWNILLTNVYFVLLRTRYLNFEQISPSWHLNFHHGLTTRCGWLDVRIFLARLKVNWKFLHSNCFGDRRVLWITEFSKDLTSCLAYVWSISLFRFGFVFKVNI